MAVKTSNQHHIGPFKAQTGEVSALRLCMPTQIQLKTVKTVEMEPESAVLWLLRARPDQMKPVGHRVRRGDLGCGPHRGAPICAGARGDRSDARASEPNGALRGSYGGGVGQSTITDIEEALPAAPPTNQGARDAGSITATCRDPYT